jgi:hypothetical protein
MRTLLWVGETHTQRPRRRGAASVKQRQDIAQAEFVFKINILEKF